jgi:ABC-type dipeptide/oligopeptide/nickel transport system permease subunit
MIHGASASSGTRVGTTSGWVTSIAAGVLLRIPDILLGLWPLLLTIWLLLLSILLCRVRRQLISEKVVVIIIAAILSRWGSGTASEVLAVVREDSEEMNVLYCW